jgi:hypothetical protein
LTVWAVAGALFLCVVLFAHVLPDPKVIETVRHYNIQRLSRFYSKAAPHPPRIIVVGTSLSTCALFFDEEMEQFARKNGLPDLEFVRFIKLDATLKDFVPLLGSIIAAEPDVVFFETNAFVLSRRSDDNPDSRMMRIFSQDDSSDDRKKLQLFFQAKFLGKGLPRKKDNPNVSVSEKEVLLKLRQRQTQDDFEQFREEALEPLQVRPFSVPDEYLAFFNAMKQKHITAALLDLPRSRKAESAFPPEMRKARGDMIKRYQNAYGLRYVSYPELLGLEYFQDFTHMNERGRGECSRWFLSGLPSLIERGKAL